MRNIILRVPTLVFILLYFLPGGLGPLLPKSQFSFLVLLTLSYLIGMIWRMSIVEYMASELNSRKLVLIIHSMLLLPLVFAGIVYSFSLEIENSTKFILGITFHIMLSAVLANYVRKVFYERSEWFVFLEFFVTIFGILTLTPTIKKWEKEKSSPKNN